MCRARVIATWRIGLRAPLFARNYKMDATIRYLYGLFVYQRRWSDLLQPFRKMTAARSQRAGKFFRLTSLSAVPMI